MFHVPLVYVVKINICCVLLYRTAKYREYHQLFEKGEVVAAGKLLVSLLTSNTVPKK